MTDLDRDIRACGKFDIAHPYFCGPSERAAISISTAPCTAVCSDDAGAVQPPHRRSRASFLMGGLRKEKSGPVAPAPSCGQQNGQMRA
jgi:hypothetical protein